MLVSDQGSLAPLTVQGRAGNQVCTTCEPAVSGLERTATAQASHCAPTAGDGTLRGMRPLLPRVLLPTVLAALLVPLAPSSAGAHSLDSSTVSVHVGDGSVDGTISVALEALDDARSTDHASLTDVDVYADDVIAYLDEHLTVSSSDGQAWDETWTDPVRESVEGIDSFSVDVALDPGSEDAAAFVLDYDAVIEADAGHEAVVVLTDAAGEISTAGVLHAGDTTVSIGTSAHGWTDMAGLGLHHVLQGADHLLFLAMLLLVAPVAVAAGRWRASARALPSLRSVLGVATAFTVGHSITLIASALGWISVPSAPVEVLIAASVGVSALHAIRPLVAHGEELIAAGFGLVHGLAFAGILADLGLQGATSVPSLLGFNLGVELAQLLTIALVFPSLYLAARTRWYPWIRTSLAAVALAASAGWAFDRLGLLANPLGVVEEAAVAHLSWVCAALAGLAAVAWTAEQRAIAPAAP